jgi:hypothetical protein
MEVSSEVHIPAVLLPWKKARFPLHRKLTGSSGFLDVEANRNFLFLPVIEPLLSSELRCRLTCELVDCSNKIWKLEIYA